MGSEISGQVGDFLYCNANDEAVIMDYLRSFVCSSCSKLLRNEDFTHIPVQKSL